jgi:hypothetical protein
MGMPGRKYDNGTEYRYGFNKQEKSDEIAIGLTTALYWEYDSRIGRRWNIDPKPTIGMSDYSTFNNNPNSNSDVLGDSTSGGPGPKGFIGIGLIIGSNNTGININISLTQKIGNFNLSAGAGATYFKQFSNTGKSGLELRGSAMGSFDDGKHGFALGTNVFRGLGEMSEFKQRTGILSFKLGDFSAAYENDGSPFTKLHLSDGYDSYRTAAVRINIGEFSAGFNLFTGKRQDYSGDRIEGAKGKQTGNFGIWMPHGYVKEEGPKYRMGAAYIGYGEAKLGITSDRWIRHPIQDIGAHHYLSPQPGFQTLSKKIKPFYQYSTNASPIRFTLND